MDVVYSKVKSEFISLSHVYFGVISLLEFECDFSLASKQREKNVVVDLIKQENESPFCFISKFCFIKRVDKCQIISVKDLESLRPLSEP